MWRGSWTQLIDIGLERGDLIGSYSYFLVVLDLELIDARLKLIVPLLLLYILLLSCLELKALSSTFSFSKSALLFTRASILAS